MHNLVEPTEDGLPLRESGPWVAEKLDYLKRFIDVFETAMRNKFQRRYYIDLFAGPGKCVCGKSNTIHLGSPLIALTTRFPFTDYIFADKDEKSIKTLETRCKLVESKVNVQFMVGDANALAPEIARLVHKAASLNLAFLDPEGLELQWKTIAALARIKKLDMIIHYSQMGLTRNMPIEIKKVSETSIDRFFGETEWRKIYEEHITQGGFELDRRLMDQYRGNLAKLGYKETLRDEDVLPGPVMRNEKNVPLYRLIFASRHPLGNKFWKEITNRDVHGQRRLF